MKFKLKFFIFGLIFFCATQSKSQNKSTSLPIKIFKNLNSKPLIFYVSGDGGWNDFSNQLASGLYKNGYAVVGIDSRKYFWSKKTPTNFANDLQSLISQYLKEWNKREFIIIGYSFGADVSAFLPANFNHATADKFKEMILLSPGYSTSYEVKLMDMLNSGGNSNLEKYKVYPEILKANLPITCVFGSDDDSDFKSGLKETKNIHKIIIKGNHHYDDDFSLVLKTVLKVIE
jgi:type IV secretory pathway VirJ component